MNSSDSPFSFTPLTALQWQLCADRASSFPCAATPLKDPPRQQLSPESSIERKWLGKPCGDAALNAAVAYVESAAANAQLDAVKSQETAATRLLEIESKRVVERVDDPVKLLRAKLLAARTRLLAAELQNRAVSVRGTLAALTGATADQLRLLVDSIPVIESLEIENAGDIIPSLSEALAARDIAQLEFVLAHRERIGTNARILADTSNLGDLVACYINEQEKFSVLLGIQFDVQRAELWRLYGVGELGNWVTGKEQGLLQRNTSGQDLGSKPLISSMKKARDARTMRTIMITPVTKSLTVGGSQQFSAIGIYDDGIAVDATLKAIWRCSSNSAVVSRSGLFTALSTGRVTVTATLDGTSQSLQLAITAESPTLLNP